MSPIDHYLHAVIMGAAEEVRREGAAKIEAQHLLLAVAAQQGTEPQRLLAAAGLDVDAIRSAIDREFDHSLSAAGVSRAGYGPAPSRGPLTRQPPMGATGKLALDRAVGSARRKKDMRPVHLLRGILLAEVGTVPRALALAGVDRAALLDRIGESLAAGAE